MCGIVGFINKENKIGDEKEIIKNMLAVQRHRGPDDSGIEKFELNNKYNGYLGFNRLSILDLSMNGHQPMYNCTKDIVITFNGEIYNAFDLKDKLIEKGYEFRSKTDTEVLLHLYEEYGIEDMLPLITGMFAFVIIDKRKNKIYAARDRMGEKPFYYYRTDHVILFASEIKTFYKHPSFAAKINENVLDEYFIYRYVSGNETLLQGVKTLEPSCYMELGFEREEIKKYYCQKVRVKRKSHIECRKKLEKELRESTQRQLISDVPVGIMLSGGIDSSLVAKYASEQSNLQSFSVVFDNPKYSEEKWIDFISEKLQIKENKYKISEKSFLDNFIKCVWHCDFPLNHPNSLGVYLLCARAKEKVTVLLGGEGADELLGGYGNATLGCTDLFLRSFAGSFYDKLHLRKMFNKFSEEKLDYDTTYVLSSAYSNKQQTLELRPNADIPAVIKKRVGILNSISGNNWHKYSEYDQRTYLVDILNRVDKMSMASSMEVRCPFLDKGVTDCVRTFRTNLLVLPSFRKKRIVYNGKKLLKEIAKKNFGENFTYREKMGWPMPLKEYFLKEPMKGFIENQLLPGMKRRQIINMLPVKSWWKNLEELTAREVETLWIAISFETWAQIFIDYSGDILRFTADTARG
ncbi:asparagine synthase (glutamine-hydrolyzing) [Lachnospiraceae bacterium 38-10]